MRTCGISLCLIFFMIQLIYSREYARPSPTDMPYSQRDVLNKKESMKNYFKTLKSFKVARPDSFNNETEGIGNLLVEDAKIRIPFSVRGLSEVTKIYLDQNRLSRYLRILDMELERTPATIELDSSKIVNYVKMLKNENRHKGKSADLVSRSRIKLMKSGITDNIIYDEKGHEQEADYYYEEYPLNKRGAESIANVKVGQNGLFFNSDITGKEPEGNINEDSGCVPDYSKSASDTGVQQYMESEIYDLDPDYGNQLLDENIKQSANEKNIFPENIEANKFKEEDIGNKEAEQLDKEIIEKMEIQILSSSATEHSGLASVRGVDSEPQESARNIGEPDLQHKHDVGDNNEKPMLHNWSYENSKNKDLSLLGFPFSFPVPINHFIPKDYGGHDEKKTNNDSKGGVGFQDPKMDQQMKHGGFSFENTNSLDLNGTVHGRYPLGSHVKDINREKLGSILNNLQNKLYNMEPIQKSTQKEDTLVNFPKLNNSSLSQQFLQNINDNKDVPKAINIKSAAIFDILDAQNLSTTESLFSLNAISNDPSDHRVFPLKPEDEIVNIPNLKYFEECFNGENNHCQFIHDMPTKPPQMFSKYYISRLKNFEKYDDDAGSLNFLKRPRFPLFGTKINELSKILNVNLEHLHIDKDALFKIIGKALKVDEEHKQDYAPPKWLKHKYEELLYASHRGQNSNDYDYIEKSMQNSNRDRFNIRDRKETDPKRNNTRS